MNNGKSNIAELLDDVSRFSFSFIQVLAERGFCLGESNRDIPWRTETVRDNSLGGKIKGTFVSLFLAHNYYYERCNRNDRFTNTVHCICVTMCNVT